MLLSVMVIDDFYDNPMDVRKAALALEYDPIRPDTPYPGRNSKQPLLWPNADQMFSQILREPVRGNYDLAHGRFRLSTAGDVRGADIHIDPGTVWAGVLFMTLPQHCRGGTEFFRHREYGTESAPLTQEDVKAYGPGETDRDKLVDRLTEIDGRDRSKWDLIMTVPMRFNRLVLFRGWAWHTAGESFGNAPENCRLVQLFFFRSAQIAGMRR
ncbi:MAG: DUF6445 family protein [Reyranellaceae bacterium]